MVVVAQDAMAMTVVMTVAVIMTIFVVVALASMRSYLRH
jgi:hypothetical protein